MNALLQKIQTYDYHQLCDLSMDELRSINRTYGLKMGKTKCKLAQNIIRYLDSISLEKMPISKKSYKIIPIIQKIRTETVVDNIQSKTSNIPRFHTLSLVIAALILTVKCIFEIVVIFAVCYLIAMIVFDYYTNEVLQRTMMVL